MCVYILLTKDDILTKYEFDQTKFRDFEMLNKSIRSIRDSETLRKKI